MKLFTYLILLALFGNQPLYAKKSKQDELDLIARNAYKFLFPLVMMDVTKKKFNNTSYKNFKNGVPVNVFQHRRKLPKLDTRDVVRTNFDTLYSLAWVDVSKEPMVLELPDSKGRYYLVPAMDMWSDNFASIGSRTTGTAKTTVMYVKKNWQGKAPKGVEVIRCPTDMIWLVGRMDTRGPDDYAEVNKFQDGMSLKSYSTWKSGKPFKGYISTDKNFNTKVPPKKMLIGMSAKNFFTYAAELMTKYPPHETDYNIVLSMKKLGIEAGKPLKFASLSAAQQKALKRAPMKVLRGLKAAGTDIGKKVNGWNVITHNMGVYGIEYKTRTMISLVGLGANQPADAIYPLTRTDKNGDKLRAIHSYKLHFEKKDLPPVDAFWSITVYNDDGFTNPNSLNRATLSSWMPLKYNDDGSLDLLFSHSKPKADMMNNWYPLPRFGVFNLTMRLYAPDIDKIESGAWKPPAVERAEVAH